jgi:CheY-like chemotaxis protein
MNSIRVLIVDDNKDAAASLARLLGALGKETRVAHDGSSALTAFAEFQPQVLFLDLGLPGMDGVETANRIRELPAGKNCVFIALTGWGEQEDRRRTTEAGFHAHLLKPLKVDQLEATLEKLLADQPPVG